MFPSYHKAPARLAIAIPLLVGTPSTPLAESLIDPEGPFRMGEGYADRPATDNRITLTITGRLAVVEWDGTLAHPVMCGERDVQVMCVTYSKEGRHVGDTVLFAGGYARYGARRIMLDPCLASPEE
ncbi:hypothetical protein [Ciceribacter sp. RN22]|uniref:hypothetical protein n=1 Tax=Ciceribacter sp. RN22 TaxID=2954932 RepID=UPI00209316EA|nr:hypothetical protein [Ciceribacter sp. RN22]MCO6177641.1 hypothetical protein [Ciceribacter sp. RN22]